MGKVLLIPTVLYEDALETIPAYVKEGVQQCTFFFVENEKTTRSYFKKLWREMVIEDYIWHAIHKVETEQIQSFKELLKAGKNIGIISEAGCAGVADPGQILVGIAQEMGAQVKPYVGPNSILLALMASGMNGQLFQFHGYLPIDSAERKKKIQALEQDMRTRNCTQICIETPYRNDQLLDAILQSCHASTKVCIGVDLTGPSEWIKTGTVDYWKKNKPSLHKKLAVFLIGQ